MPSALRLQCFLHPGVDDVNGQRKNDGGVLLRANFGERLKVTKLDSGRLSFQHTGSFGEFGGGFVFACGVNDLSAPLALRFGLARNGPLHLFRNIDLLHFHLSYLNTPRLRILVKDQLQLGVNLFAFGEDFVEFELADDAAQSGLRLLRSGVEIVLHLGKRQVCIHNAEVANRVYFNGNVIAGNDVLRRHVESFNAQRDAIKSLDGPEDQAQSGRLRFGHHASQTQNHSALPFLDDVERVPEPNQEDDYDNERAGEAEVHRRLLPRAAISGDTAPQL